MQLQKLVFLAQGYCLALLDRALFHNHVHAWQWGPVIPKLYKPLQKYGAGVVCEPIPSEDTIEGASQEDEVIRAVWDSFGHFTGAQLSGLTHENGTPWSVTWEANKFGVISEDLIKDHYRRLLASNAA